MNVQAQYRLERWQKLAKAAPRLGGKALLKQLRRAWRGYEGAMVQVENTSQCNFRCVYCVTHSPDAKVHPPRRHMAVETFRSIAENHRDALLMIIQGQGEPLMDPTLFEKLSIARASGLLTQILTNGSLIDEDRAERLAKEGPDLVLVSLDLASPESMARHRLGMNYERVADGRSTPCCVLSDERYTAPEWSRARLLERFQDNDMPPECLRCSNFALS
jgi:MoaA/NifB/PqqE/SkfB family radical SAM enzyme